jgi:hypothetical protein
MRPPVTNKPEAIMSTSHETPDTIFQRARELVEDSNRVYEEFLEAWGIDQTSIERAAKGEHIRSPERRRALEEAILEVDSVREEPPASSSIDFSVPQHAIRC